MSVAVAFGASGHFFQMTDIHLDVYDHLLISLPIRPFLPSIELTVLTLAISIAALKPIR